MPLKSRRSRTLTAASIVTGVTAATLVSAHFLGASAASAAITSSAIYVANAASAHCSDTGTASGSQAQPFCTISAAAAIAQPGQTVFVEPGTYQPVTISVSGEPGNPVTFQGATTGAATVQGTDSTGAFLITGAHHVVISGFTVNSSVSDVATSAYQVTGSSSDITINGGMAFGLRAAGSPKVATIEVDAASGVTISRATLFGDVPVQVDAGASGVVVTGNTIGTGSGAPAVSVTDAPGTDVTGNTVLANCGPGIVLSGASAGAYREQHRREHAGRRVRHPRRHHGDLSISRLCRRNGLRLQPAPPGQ